MERVVIPEILDNLAVDDPRAIASRRDLRVINFLMGNERWIVRQLGQQGGRGKVSELGAGRGELVHELANEGWESGGYDLQPRPPQLNEKANWEEGDFFKTLAEDDSSVVIGSLILHHFEDEELKELGALLSRKKLLLFAEPLRSSFAMMQGYALFPFCNEVTRHDMMVSIRAGFVKGELASKLGLTKGWTWRETVTRRGGLRLSALRS